MMPLAYLSGYPSNSKSTSYFIATFGGNVTTTLPSAPCIRNAQKLLGWNPTIKEYSTDSALYQRADSIKNRYFRHSLPLSKVCYDNKIQVLKQALGMHTAVSRVQGSKLKTKAKIRFASMFKHAP